MAKKKKAKAKPKTKAKAKPRTKAKAKPKTKPKTKVKPKAKAKPKAKTKKKTTSAKAKTPARKKTKKAVAPQAESPVILDEVLEEPLQDVSTVLRIKDRLATSRRDVDEDELKQFSDPSLVVEVEVEAQGELPSLFADEARRQQERARDQSSVTRPPSESSLFGLDDDDEDEG